MVTSSSDDVGSARETETSFVSNDHYRLRKSSRRTDRNRVVKVLLGRAHLDGDSDCERVSTNAHVRTGSVTGKAHDAGHRNRRIVESVRPLTALEDLVRAFADDVQTDHLLLLANADQLVRRGLLVLLVEHGEGHGLELDRVSADV